MSTKKGRERQTIGRAAPERGELANVIEVLVCFAAELLQSGGELRALRASKLTTIKGPTGKSRR